MERGVLKSTDAGRYVKEVLMTRGRRIIIGKDVLEAIVIVTWRG